MITAILAIVGSALSIWDSKLKQKYVDKSLQLERDYYKAINAVGDERDNALIDNLEREIEQLAKSLALELRGKS